MYNRKTLQQQLTNVLNAPRAPIEEIVTKEQHTDLLTSHLEALELIEILETALAFYSDETKYYYARKDHPNTRLAEDSEEIARNALQSF